MVPFSIERKIALLITAAVFIVGTAGFITYQSLNYILSAIQKEAQPNLSLVILKEINSSLLKGESNIKYYTLSGDSKYLIPYHEIIGSVDKKIDQLKQYNKENTLRGRQIDSISNLIDKKFIVWQRMLQVRTSNRVGEALSRLEVKLDSVADTITMKVPTSVKVYKADSNAQKSKTEISAEDEKGNFFTRLFKRKTEPEAEPAKQDPLALDILEENIESKDTTLGIGIDKSQIQAEISRIKQEEGDFLRTLTAQEIYLISQNDRLSQKINKLIVRMEREEIKSINQKATEADKLVESTNRLMVFFLLALTVLLFVVFYVIQRYVRKSNLSQKTLIEAREQALNLSQAKELFIANMSHEIRTPMNAIVGFSEQILKDHPDNETKDQLEIIKKSADHLLHIINDILDFSKLEAGKLNLENTAFSPSGIILEVVSLYKPAIESKGLILECNIDKTIPEIVNGDPHRLKQILFNLLNNAVKFTSLGSISIRARVSDYEDEIARLEITIADTGIGIPADKTDLVFEEFNQAETSTTRRFGGTGLGLSIVKRLIDLQHGKISLSSVPGQGSIFIITIPYSIGKKENLNVHKTANSYSWQNLAGKSFMVADDDEYNRKLIAHILDKWKVRYTLVSNGIQLLEKICDLNYDIILMDIRMPELDGIQTTKQIREANTESIKNIPVLVLTATVAKDEIIKCENAGVNAILPKPFTEEILLETVSKLLKIEATEVIHPANTDLAESQKINSELPEDYGFDGLYKLANNDTKFVKEMLEMFIKTSREGLINLYEGLERKDLEMIAENAHKIKSPCKHLGAGKTGEFLKTIEDKARNGGNIEELRAMVEQTKVQIEELIVRIREHLVLIEV